MCYQPKYYIADETNGEFTGGFLTENEALKELDFWIKDGIKVEKEMQEESGFTDSEIEERVKNFYSIIIK